MKRNNSQSKEVDEVVPEVVGEGGGRRNFIKMIKKKKRDGVKRKSDTLCANWSREK